MPFRRPTGTTELVVIRSTREANEGVGARMRRRPQRICATGAATLSFEPFGDHGRAGVDADELRAAGSVARELGRHVGWCDNDVAGTDRHLFPVELEGEVAFLDDPGLVIRMAVKAGAVAWVAVVEDERDGGAVVGAFEVSGFEGAGVDDWHATSPFGQRLGSTPVR